MTSTPRSDALAAMNFDPAIGFGVAAIDLARELETRLRDQDRACGEMRAKLARAEAERDAAVERAHKLRLEAKGYHNSLLRCETDARRWHWVRTHMKHFWNAAIGAAPGDSFLERRELDSAVDAAMVTRPMRRRAITES